ncbi:hypothetical protein OOZ15_17700 [Galbibacter sp. EGI 63066]|uniref:hypothetical protein n=1 Tax=Galbibacter sp. EGI 63066 TaxID=2993559 RepID=UPI002248BFE8|nr:hypothetical protein [Galbibacter sp. EGI 63066]MCX2681793.1 hypothetical protein [Galbibacter sp. EGI 63066]
MRKYIVLGVLFVLPIVVYLFFASGVNNFGKLPILTKGVENIEGLHELDNKDVDLKEKITILVFLGSELSSKKLNAFNLNQKIYKRFNGFEDFQFVSLLPEGTEEQATEIKNELNPLTDVSNWHFVFASEEKIKSVFESLKTSHSLSDELYTPYTFIIDREVNLRGRKKDDDTKKELYGYDATSVAVINNKMIDDIKVLLAEYRLAKKSNNKTDAEPQKNKK